MSANRAKADAILGYYRVFDALENLHASQPESTSDEEWDVLHARYEEAQQLSDTAFSDWCKISQDEMGAE